MPTILVMTECHQLEIEFASINTRTIVEAIFQLLQNLSKKSPNTCNDISEFMETSKFKGLGGYNGDVCRSGRDSSGNS